MFKITAGSPVSHTGVGQPGTMSGTGRVKKIDIIKRLSAAWCLINYSQMAQKAWLEFWKKATCGSPFIDVCCLNKSLWTFRTMIKELTVNKSLPTCIGSLRFVSGSQHLQAALIIDHIETGDRSVQFIGAGKSCFPICACVHCDVG